MTFNVNKRITNRINTFFYINYFKWCINYLTIMKF